MVCFFVVRFCACSEMCWCLATACKSCTPCSNGSRTGAADPVLWLSQSQAHMQLHVLLHAGQSPGHTCQLPLYAEGSPTSVVTHSLTHSCCLLQVWLPWRHVAHSTGCCGRCNSGAEPSAAVQPGSAGSTQGHHQVSLGTLWGDKTDSAMLRSAIGIDVARSR